MTADTGTSLSTGAMGTDARGRPLREADPFDLEHALAYAPRFGARGEPWRADLRLQERDPSAPYPAAGRLVEHPRLAGYIVIQEPPVTPHTT